MNYTRFGKKMTCDAGILSLMDDLGKAKAECEKQMIMMGGGNPGQVPEFQELMRTELLAICREPSRFNELIGAYSPPQGETRFLNGLASLLKDQFGWPIGPENICLTNGSQTGFFMLFNLFGGVDEQGVDKKICLPLAPEYIGYADLGIEEDLFVSTKPAIEILPNGFFKYRIDFNALKIDETIGAICISRPTNPTGNVITDGELQQLSQLANNNNIPLVVDCAYGLPFPGIIFTDATPLWNENMVVSLSLSKLGLPAVRTGIIVASEPIVKALTAMNAIMSLSPNSFGALLAEKIVVNSEITNVSRDLIKPFYQRKMKRAVAEVKKQFVGIPCRIHIPEGAMFLWFWFKDLPVTSLELYQRLKKAGVLVVSGHYFFPGLADEWSHRHECIRVTYSQDDTKVKQGIKIIAEVVREAYSQKDL